MRYAAAKLLSAGALPAALAAAHQAGALCWLYRAFCISETNSAKISAK